MIAGVKESVSSSPSYPLTQISSGTRIRNGVKFHKALIPPAIINSVTSCALSTGTVITPIVAPYSFCLAGKSSIWKTGMPLIMLPSKSSRTSKPATISNPYWLSPVSCNKEAPRLPTPNRNALCWDVKPRKSSSTSTNALISYPTLVFPEIFTKERSLATWLGSTFISLAIWVDEINVSPFPFINFTNARYHGNLLNVGSGTFHACFISSLAIV